RALLEQGAGDELALHERAARGAAPDLEDADVAQDLDRLPERRPADVHPGGEEALGGKAVPDPEVASPDRLGDLVDDLLEGPARADGAEDGGTTKGHALSAGFHDMTGLCPRPWRLASPRAASAGTKAAHQSPDQRCRPRPGPKGPSAGQRPFEPLRIG